MGLTGSLLLGVSGQLYVAHSLLKTHEMSVPRGSDFVGVLTQSFFTLWWPEQSEHTQNLVRQLVKNKQLGFVNGG